MARMAAPIRAEALAGETVDALTWGKLRQAPEALKPVLDANPNLADLGAFLPAGTPVLLPAAASEPAAAPMINLWD